MKCCDRQILTSEVPMLFDVLNLDTWPQLHDHTPSLHISIVKITCNILSKYRKAWIKHGDGKVRKLFIYVFNYKSTPRGVRSIFVIFDTKWRRNDETALCKNTVMHFPSFSIALTAPQCTLGYDVNIETFLHTIKHCHTSPTKRPWVQSVVNITMLFTCPRAAQTVQLVCRWLPYNRGTVSISHTTSYRKVMQRFDATRFVFFESFRNLAGASAAPLP